MVTYKCYAGLFGIGDELVHLVTNSLFGLNFFQANNGITPFLYIGKVIEYEKSLEGESKYSSNKQLRDALCKYLEKNEINDSRDFYRLLKDFAIKEDAIISDSIIQNIYDDLGMTGGLENRLVKKEKLKLCTLLK